MDERALAAQSELMDGKLLLVSNTTDLTPAQLLLRYEALSEIEIAPVHHRLAKRIRPHTMLWFKTLIVYRVVRPG